MLVNEIASTRQPIADGEACAAIPFAAIPRILRGEERVSFAEAAAQLGISQSELGSAVGAAGASFFREADGDASLSSASIGRVRQYLAATPRPAPAPPTPMAAAATPIASSPPPASSTIQDRKAIMTSTAVGDTAGEMFQRLVGEQVSAGVPRPRAVAAVAARHPRLHADALSETNPHGQATDVMLAAGRAFGGPAFAASEFARQHNGPVAAARIYDRTETPPAIPAAPRRGQAKAKFDGLLRDRLAQKLEQRQLFNRHAQLGPSDGLAARQEIFNENPGLRDQMIAEANQGDRGKWGLRPGQN